MHTLTRVCTIITRLVAPVLVVGTLAIAAYTQPVESPWGGACHLDWCRDSTATPDTQTAQLEAHAARAAVQDGYECDPLPIQPLPSYLYIEDMEGNPSIIPFDQAALDGAPGNYWILEGCNPSL